MFTDTHVREVNVNYKSSAVEKFKIRSPEHVAEFVRGVLPDNSREHCVALYLDGSHQVIGYSVISTGTANVASFHPREIFQRAILIGAVSFAFAHNHPSGSLDASSSDDQITKQLYDASKLLGIRLLDHTIVTDNSHYSYKEAGHLFN